MQTARLRQTWPFQALGDETRLRVMRLLISAAGPLTAGQLAEAICVPPSHLSRHLQILDIAGLTSTARSGKTHYVSASVASGSLEALCAAVRALSDDTKVFSEDNQRLSRLSGLGVES
jgi:DNA-binding transcriptional ArsR family regulator